MCEFRSFVLPANGIRRLPPTWVWGYLVDPDPGGSTPCEKLISLYADANGVVDTYTGPVIVNQRFGGATDVTYVSGQPNVPYKRLLFCLSSRTVTKLTLWSRMNLW